MLFTLPSINLVKHTVLIVQIRETLLKAWFNNVEAVKALLKIKELNMRFTLTLDVSK